MRQAMQSCARSAQHALRTRHRSWNLRRVGRVGRAASGLVWEGQAECSKGGGIADFGTSIAAQIIDGGWVARPIPSSPKPMPWMGWTNPHCLLLLLLLLLLS